MDKDCVLVIFTSKNTKIFEDLQSDFQDYMAIFKPENISNEIRFHRNPESIIYSSKEYKGIPVLVIIADHINEATLETTKKLKRKKYFATIIYSPDYPKSETDISRLLISDKDMDKNKLFEIATSAKIQKRILEKDLKGFKSELKKILDRKTKKQKVMV